MLNKDFNTITGTTLAYTGSIGTLYINKICKKSEIKGLLNKNNVLSPKYINKMIQTLLI